MIEAGLIRQRTGEGMAIPRARGKLRGKPPKLSPAQTREAHRMHASGDYAIAQVAQLFSVSRLTIYRALQRTTGGADLPLTPAHAPTWRNAIRCCPRAGQAEVSPGRE